MLKNAFHKLEKILNIYTLGFLNLAIILFAEFSGNGRFFQESGLIHVIGIIFPAVILILLFFGQYLIFDAILRRALKFFLGAFILSGLLHSIIHILEVGKNFLTLEAIKIDMIIVYAISFILILIAAEIPWNVYVGRFKFSFINYIGLIFILVAVMLFTIINKNLTLWIKNSFAPELLLVLLLIFGIYAIYNINKKIKNLMPLIFGKFSNFIIAAIGVNMISGLFEFFALRNPFGLSLIQSVYISHFLFYIGSSFLILAFANLLTLPGIYQDIHEMIEKGEYRPWK